MHGSHLADLDRASYLRSAHVLQQVCVSYLLFLMVVTRKHSLEEAARFSGLHKSQFSKLLQTHANVAISTLEDLSKKQAKQLVQNAARLAAVCPGRLRF